MKSPPCVPVQYKEAPSSVLIALQLLFSLSSGRGWVRRNIPKPSWVKHMVSQLLSAFFGLRDESPELRGALAVRESAEHQWMNWRDWKLEDFLWMIFLPRRVSLLPFFPSDTHRCQEYYKWKCFFFCSLEEFSLLLRFSSSHVF